MNIEEIKELILLKQEDSYWDFKREWYAQDKKQIYFMILCVWQIIYLIEMLIFIIGVDEENDYSFSSVKTDLNRRNTQQLVNFIWEKHFAGGVRPIVSVESLGFDEIEIDVIVVHNSDVTPFYLTEKFQSVMPNNIYTRVMDSNTPKNKSVDLSHIEML